MRSRPRRGSRVECTGFTSSSPIMPFQLRHPPVTARGAPQPSPRGSLVAWARSDRFPVARTHRAAGQQTVTNALVLPRRRARRPSLAPRWKRRSPASILSDPRRDADHGARAAGLCRPPRRSLALALGVTAKHPRAVRAAGTSRKPALAGREPLLGDPRSTGGAVFTRHRYEDVVVPRARADGRVHLDIPRMLAALRALSDEPAHARPRPHGGRASFVPTPTGSIATLAWRRVDREGAMACYPDDAKARGLTDARATCTLRSEARSRSR